MSERPRRSARPRPHSLAEYDGFHYFSDYASSESSSDYEEAATLRRGSQETALADHLHNADDYHDEIPQDDTERAEEEEDRGVFSTATVYHPTSKYQEPVYNEALALRSPLWPMLTLYDVHRKPRSVQSGRCQTSVQQVLQSFRCVICWSTMKNPKAVRECMHRFCEECISTALRMGRHECPYCRVFVPSKRNLAVDESAEILMANLLGPQLRTMEAADLEKELAGSAKAGHFKNNNKDDDDDDDGEDSQVSRLRKAKRSLKYAERPFKKAKTGDENDREDDSHTENDDDDDDDDDNDDDMERPLPTLVDFHLQPHQTERALRPLTLPYIRISGDATVATLVKFIRAKLACDHLHITQSSSSSSRPIPLKTPLYMLGALTDTLYYRLRPRHVEQPRWLGHDESLSSTARLLEEPSVQESVAAAEATTTTTTTLIRPVGLLEESTAIGTVGN